jgi:hypothetical protein
MLFLFRHINIFRFFQWIWLSDPAKFHTFVSPKNKRGKKNRVLTSSIAGKTFFKCSSWIQTKKAKTQWQKH